MSDINAKSDDMRGVSTRDGVLRLLGGPGEKEISGEELALRLGVSRNAVWKAVKALQAQGYNIQSLRGRGYRLVEDSNILSRALVERRLDEWSGNDPAVKGILPRIIVLDTVDSTNNYCKALPETDLPVVVASDEQTAGRGRRGKSFSSPKGYGLYFSFAFRPEFSMEDSMNVTAVAASVARQVLADLSGKPVEIKWVNDLYLHGKKIAGILTEGVAGLEEQDFERIVVGIGINCFSHPLPPELRDIAGALWDDEPADTAHDADRANGPSRPEGESSFARNDLLARLSLELTRAFCGRDRLDARRWLDDYREHCFITGREVLVEAAGRQPYSALVTGVDDDFALVVEPLEGPDAGTEKHLTSGQVSLKL